MTATNNLVFFTYILLFSITNLLAQSNQYTERIKNLEEMNSKQKVSPRFNLYLFTGLDWDPISRKSLQEWNSKSFDQLCKGMRLLHSDHSNYNQINKDSKDIPSFHFRPRVYSFPAIVLKNKEGIVIGIKQNLNGQPDELSTAVKEWMQRYTLFQAKLKESLRSSGIEKARLLGLALDTLSYKVARSHKNLCDEIERHDPEDKSGYVLKYSLFESDSMGDKARVLGRRGTKQELLNHLSSLQKMLNNQVLNTIQRQEILAAIYGCHMYLKGTDKAEKQKAVLEAIIKLDPNTIPALGAKGLLLLERKKEEYDKRISTLEKKPNDKKALNELISLGKDLYKIKPISYIDTNILPKKSLIGDLGIVSASSYGGKERDRWKMNMLLKQDCSSYAYTKKELNPWIQVSFDKPERVTNILIGVKRSEVKSNIPLVIEVSNDGKNWQEVGRKKQAKESHFFHLTKAPSVRFIRCRIDGTSKAQLHLINFLIFGQ